MNDVPGRGEQRSRTALAIERMMRPKSVAIVGISSKSGTAGHAVLNNLTVNNFPGAIHLVNRSGGTIADRPVLTSIDELPEGVDVAVFTLPAAAVRESIAACVRRKVGAGVIFASGFAELGNRAEQEEVARIAREGGMVLLGPNCLGYQNYIEGLWIGFTGGVPIKKIGGSRDPAFAVISQSGGLASHFKWALEARDLPVAYQISTGNEAVLGLADFIEYLADDPTTRAIIAYVEQIRRPDEFMAAVAHARSRGKPVLMVHPGRSARAKEATGSHTGALAGDHAVMRARLTHAGIPLFDTLDELVDAAEILLRYPQPPIQGLGILTFSGAYCALSYDMADDLDLELPALSPDIETRLKARLPPYAPPRNPLDLGTQALWELDIVGVATKALLDDPNLGALLISIPSSSARHSIQYLKDIIAAKEGSRKPLVLAMLGDRSPLPPEFMELARENRVILSRSSERSFRAMAHVIAYGQSLAELQTVPPAPKPFTGLPKLGHGPQPEWLGKQLLAAIGLKTPAGGLATTAAEAKAIADRLGYPVAMKAQAAALAHKTEAGGVALHLADAAAVHGAWEMLHANIGRAQPGLKLDGVLVEKMAPKGLELMVGAKRDPTWGPIVLVGLGGIWVEALGDVRLLPPDLPEPAIVEELLKLRTAKLLHGFRGAPAVDIEAVARAAALVGRLMLTEPEIVEIDINPLFAHPRGDGVTAVDALVITR